MTFETWIIINTNPQELNGYDDKNFHIKEDPNVKNPLITTHCPHGYVLKIMNSMDSTNLDVVDAQNEIMNFLSEYYLQITKIAYLK